MDSLSLRNLKLHVRNPAPGREEPAAYLNQPFGDATLLGVAHDGSGLVVVDRTASAAARGTFRVRRFDARGRRLWTSRVPYTARTLSRAASQRVVDSIAEGIAREPEFGAASAAAAAAWVRRTLFVPRYLPPVTAVVVARDGRIWLRREETDGATVAWQILDRAGQVTGSLLAPRGLRLLEADATHAWGVLPGADDVPFVVRYRIAPTRP